MKNLFNEEREGFAITLEVLVTLVVITMFLTMNLYILRVMNVQRYMNTILTSTAAEASRWGGTNSNAYRKNVSSTPLLEIANAQLNAVAPGYNCHISGSPETITSNGEKITITITYQLPSVFQTMSMVGGTNMYLTGTRTMSIAVNSIMSPGSLL